MKKMWFFVVVVVVISISGCKDANSIDSAQSYISGKILGYTKCKDDKTKEKLNFGLIIETEQDTLLSFNINLISLNIDSEATWYGAYPFERLVFTSQPDSIIFFNYRNAAENEVIQTLDFLCPQDALYQSLSLSVDKLQQVIVTDIKNRKE